MPARLWQVNQLTGRQLGLTLLYATKSSCDNEIPLNLRLPISALHLTPNGRRRTPEEPTRGVTNM